MRWVWRTKRFSLEYYCTVRNVQLNWMLMRVCVYMCTVPWTFVDVCVATSAVSDGFVLVLPDAFMSLWRLRRTLMVLLALAYLRVASSLMKLNTSHFTFPHLSTVCSHDNFWMRSRIELKFSVSLKGHLTKIEFGHEQNRSSRSS